MKALGHTFMRLLAVALIALSGMASFAGTHPAFGEVEMVICGDGGVQTITLDADGQPVAPHKGKCPHCPSCLQTPVATLAHSFAVVAATQCWEMACVIPTRKAIPRQHWMAPIARGPPINSLDDISLTLFAAGLPRGAVHRAQPMGRLA